MTHPPWAPDFIASLQALWRPGMRYAELERLTGMRVDSAFMGRLEKHVRAPWRARNGEQILPRWEQHELDRLQEMRADGRTCEEIADALCRTASAVSKMANFMGYEKTFKTRRRAQPRKKPMKLSPHFTIDELTHTSTGLPNDPPPAALVALSTLCEHLLEPLRARWGGHPIRVNSGFRSEEVNRKIRGSNTSDHMRGCAADIEIPAAFVGDAFRELHQLWTDGEIPLLKQAIRYGDAERPSFIHVSIDPHARVGKGQFLWTPSGGGAGGPYYTYRPGGA